MSKVQRAYIPGDSWLYYKIYTGSKTADQILTEVVKVATERLLKDDHIDQWFFIRYADPKQHLRVRFHYQSTQDIGAIINGVNTLLKPYIDSDLVWKVQLDTYQREIERYGEETIEVSEQLFFRESEMIVNLLSVIEGEAGEEVRWLFAMKALDKLLDDFEYNADEKLQLLDHLKTSFGREFGMNKFLKKQLDKKFKQHQTKIEEFLTFETEDIPDYKVIIDILEVKRIKTLTQVNSLRKRLHKNALDDLLYSYIHMLMNRIFRSKNRLHEMTIYQLLYRYYRIQWGIRKFKKQ